MFQGPVITGYHRAARKEAADETRQSLSEKFSAKASIGQSATATATVTAKAPQSIAQQISPDTAYQGPSFNAAQTRLTASKAVNPGQVVDNKNAINASREKLNDVKADYKQDMKEAAKGLQQSVNAVAQSQGIKPSSVASALNAGQPSGNFKAAIEIGTNAVSGQALNIGMAILDVIGDRKSVKPGELDRIVEQATRTATHPQQSGPFAAFPGKENAPPPAPPQQFAYNNLSTANAKKLLQGDHALEQEPEMKKLNTLEQNLDNAEDEQNYVLRHGNKTVNAENVESALERNDQSTLEQLSQSAVNALVDFNILGKLKIPKSSGIIGSETAGAIGQTMEPDMKKLVGDFNNSGITIKTL